jgi:hypothetical protein
MASPETIEQEKQFIAEFAEQQHPLPPEEVQQDPRNKELGKSSKALSVDDFELVRTLGTGACCGNGCFWSCEGVHADIGDRDFCASVACEAGESPTRGSRQSVRFESIAQSRRCEI